MSKQHINTHTLGFPRIGAQRELKFALEAFWRGETQAAELEHTAANLRARHWQLQREAGLDYVTVGDFALYDHVLNHIQLLGCEPARFNFSDEDELSRYFIMARGRRNQEASCCNPAPQAADASANASVYALEMTKWFDTNYHYLVPEFTANTRFNLASKRLFSEIEQAQSLGHKPKAVLIGPLTFLWLGKEKNRRLRPPRPARTPAAGVCRDFRSPQGTRRGLGANRRADSRLGFTRRMEKRV